MKKNRRYTNSRNSDDYYVLGSNAVKLNRYNEKQNERYETKQKTKKRKIKTSTNRRVNRKYGYVTSLSFVILATLGCFILLLNAQFAISSTRDEIVALENRLIDIKMDNKKIEETIASDMNLNEVYRIATQELGMITPSSDQVKFLSEEHVSYTQQFADIEIPYSDNGTSLSSIIGFISKGW